MRMRGRLRDAAVLLALPWAGAFAQEAPRLSLRDCLELARQNRPALQAEGENVHAREAELGRARAPYYPRLDLTASAQRSQARNATLGLTSRLDSWTPASLTASQLLYDFGKTGGAAGSARKEAGAAGWDLRTRAEEVSLDVKLAYFNTLASERTVLVAEEILAQRQDLLRMTRARFEKGERPRFDVTRSEIDAEAAKLQLISSKAALDIARRELLAAMGIPERPWRPIADSLEAAGPDVGEESAISAALSHRPELRAQAERTESLERLVHAAKGDYYPALSAFGSYALTSSAADGTFAGHFRNWQAGVQAQLNIFSGFSTLEGVRRSSALLAKARFDLKTLEQRTRLEVQEALFSMRASRESLESARQLSKSAEENLALWSKAYHAGKGNIIYVADAQGQLLSAKLGLIRSLADTRLAEARLEKAVGLPLSEIPR